MGPKRERRLSNNFSTDLKSSANERESGSAVSSCSFTNYFFSFCAQELADFIPEVSIIGLKGENYQSHPERLSDESLTNRQFKKSCIKKRPKIQLLYENPEKYENLKMIYMKGTYVELGVLRAIGRCLTLIPTITTLKLENCSLKYNEIKIIGKILAQTIIITDLSLNENPFPEMNFHILLQETNLQYLSLCQCDINDYGAKLISSELMYGDYTTHTLIGLNLTHNHITCTGAQYLADALRTNRTLMSLSLAGNRISDKGATAIAEVLKKFPLLHEECVERRCRNLMRLLKQKALFDEQVNLVKNTLASNTKEGMSRTVTPKKSHSATKERKKGGSQSKNAPRTQENISTLNEKPSKVPSIKLTELEKIQQSVSQTMEEDPHPYMQEVKPEDGALWCAGNFRLAHLNVAYNQIGLTGTIAFHAAVVYQDKLHHDNRRGLLQLMLQGNPIPETCSELRELLEITNNRYYSISDNLNSSNEGFTKSSVSSIKKHSVSKQSFRKNITT